MEAASSHPPDVIICDIGLPDLNGFDVIRAIRVTHPADEILAIALTGYAQPDDRDQALAAGFDVHLPKPPDFAALDHILAGVARGRA